jgi:membrane protease YdiL (CAAX protease family)
MVMKSECTILTVQPEPPDSVPEISADATAEHTSANALQQQQPTVTRGRAALEVLLCSGYPTQLLIIMLLAGFGIQPLAAGAVSPTFIFAVSAIDTVLLLGLVFLFLRLSGERAADVFFRGRNVAREMLLGVILLPAIFTVVVLVQLAIQRLAPYLRNVEVSPFTPLLGSPALLAGFIILVMVAGGVREELQRGFLLHRFEQRLGGGSIGLALTSISFGLGHTLQGWDAAMITALMGACWGAVYLSRRNVISTVTNHALFNVAQIAVGYWNLPQGA